ncbi:MAG: TetR/AcrR family transcriptional regulator [Roseovarius sp.]|jgi:AcrR family transcriptional regulator|nr:TetR/AcrR family transcriptional regulator [Roseovarius sp.]
MRDGTRREQAQNKIRRGRPVTRSCKDRRDAIFASLEAVHAERGLDGATMEAIAAHAGMSKRTLYAAFSSRSALFRAYINKVADAFIRPLSDTDTALPIAARLERVLSQGVRHQGYGLPLEILRAFIAQVPQAPDIGRDLVQTLMRRDLSILKAELDRGLDRSEIAVADTTDAALLLLDMVRPWPLESLLDPTCLATPQALAMRQRLAIRVFLNGLVP